MEKQWNNKKVKVKKRIKKTEHKRLEKKLLHKNCGHWAYDLKLHPNVQIWNNVGNTLKTAKSISTSKQSEKQIDY